MRVFVAAMRRGRCCFGWWGGGGGGGVHDDEAIAVTVVSSDDFWAMVTMLLMMMLMMPMLMVDTVKILSRASSRVCKKVQDTPEVEKLICGSDKLSAMKALVFFLRVYNKPCLGIILSAVGAEWVATSKCSLRFKVSACYCCLLIEIKA